MMDGAIAPEKIVEDLRGFGFELFIGEDGIVHGRFRQPGQRITLEMRAVIDRLGAMNEQVADILRREEEQRQKSFVGITPGEALALGERVKAGEAELIGKVTYHRQSGLCDLTVRERSGEK